MPGSCGFYKMIDGFLEGDLVSSTIYVFQRDFGDSIRLAMVTLPKLVVQPVVLFTVNACHCQELLEHRV